MSQPELARAAGMSSGYLSLLERDPSDPDAIKEPRNSTLQRLAEVLRVPFVWLALGEGKEPDWDAESAGEPAA